jgi:hypothetical protein
VVGRRDRPRGVSDGEAAAAQALESLRAGHLVDEVQVDAQDGRRARLLEHDVLVPDLLDDGARL